MNTTMSFKDALKRLNIEDYHDRILNSNSHGEWMHLADYIFLAEQFKGDASWFRTLFVVCVQFAEKEWSRPKSCFQHMPRLMREMVDVLSDKREFSRTDPPLKP